MYGAMRVFRTLVKLRERTFHWLVQRNLPCACIEASGKGFGKYITFKGISRDSLFCMPLESWEFQMPGLYYCFWFHCLWLFEMLGEEKKNLGTAVGDLCSRLLPVVQCRECLWCGSRWTELNCFRITKLPVCFWEYHTKKNLTPETQWAQTKQKL